MIIIFRFRFIWSRREYRFDERVGGKGRGEGRGRRAGLPLRRGNRRRLRSYDLGPDLIQHLLLCTPDGLRHRARRLELRCRRRHRCCGACYHRRAIRADGGSNAPLGLRVALLRRPRRALRGSERPR